MPGTVRKTTDAEDQAKRDATLRKAYTRATKDLREAHLEEFQTLHQKHAADLGVEWSPRLTPEQKAAEQMENLLAEFPHLADRFRTEDAESAEAL